MANRAGWAVLEDACHALGTQVDGTDGAWRVGDCQHSEAACFSFHPVKTIAMGEGGAITTRDAELATRMRRLRSHGMTRNATELQRTDLAFDDTGRAHPWWYEMHEVGFNYREPDILCALGLSQLRKLDRFVNRRAALLARYDQLLAPLANIVRRAPTPGQSPGWHLCTVLIDFDALGLSRAAVTKRLSERGIGTQVHYIPVPWQPYYEGLYGAFDGPGARRYYERTLTLPLFPEMKDGDVDRVVAELAAALRG
jgi:dTDP-4-amino-4,6-dideoxygalactose transaminase